MENVMGISVYLIIGLIWSAVYDALLREDGERPLTVFQGFVTIAFWPIVLIFYVISYINTIFNEM